MPKVKTKQKPSPRKALSQGSNEKGTLMREESTVAVQANPTPDGMIAIALQSNRTMEEIGKLIEFRNEEIKRLARLEYFDSKKEFARLRDRIVKVNPADYGETRSGKIGAKYMYEDLDAIEKVVKDTAAQCGFSYDWKTRYDEKFIWIKCIFTHVAGHSEEVEMRGPADSSGGKNFIQAEASTVSYLMRYTLKQVAGLSAGKDDNDGHSSTAKSDVHVKVLPFPTDAEFNAAIQSIISGKIKMEDALKYFSFNADQIESMKIAQGNTKH